MFTVGKASRLYPGSSTGYPVKKTYQEAAELAKEYSQRNPVGFDVYKLTPNGLVQVKDNG